MVERLIAIAVTAVIVLIVLLFGWMAYWLYVGRNYPW